MIRKVKKIDNLWHPLDNTGNLFPLVSNQNTTNVFRVAAQLKHPVNPIMLQKALEETVPWFSHFRFRIRRGFFWNYFEKNNEPINQVEEEDGRPCRYIDVAQNNNYLFKVFYYKNKISLEVFHALTDGTGAMTFLKTLINNYLHLINGEELCLDSEIVDVLSNVEDGYKKYSNNQKIEKNKVKSGFRLKGRKFPMYEMGVIHGFLDLNQTLALCKSKNISLTVYLVSVYIWAIFQSEQLESTCFKPIQIAVPVNLRRFFDSNTTMNFFSYISAYQSETKEELKFDTLLDHVKKQFENQISKEKFGAKIGKDVAIRRNPLIRICPLFLKNIFVKGFYLTSMNAYTSTLSNIGQIKVPNDHVEDISHFEFLLNPTQTTPVKIGVLSYDSNLVVTFTSQLLSTDLQKEYFRKCVNDGIRVRIESNGVYYENL